MKKITLILLVLLFTAAIFFAQDSKNGGEFTYGEEEFPEAFDPYSTANNMPALRISQLIFEPLVVIDEFGAVKNKLADSWIELVENQSIRFIIREGVSWHDGEPFTVDDVEFTFRALQNSRTDVNEYYKRIADKFSSISVSGNEITIELKEPTPDIAKIFSNLFIYPKHLFTGRVIRLGVLKGSALIGTGPFRFKIINSGNKIRLERNRDYYEDVYFDNMVCSVQRDPQMGVQELKFGGSDMKVNVPNSEVGSFDRGNFRIFTYSSLKIYVTALNFENPVLQNKLVRKAMLYGTDRASILSSIYYGHGQLISGPFPPNSVAYNPDVPVEDYSSYKAKNSLRTAGALDLDGDGVLELNEEKLEFNLIVPVTTNDEPLMQVADALKADLRKIGIQINVIRYEWNEFLEKLTVQRSFDLALFALVFDENVTIRPFFYGGEEKNYTNYYHQGVNELFDKYEETDDPDLKRTILYNIHETLAEDVPYVFLWTLNSMAVYNKKIRNVTIDPFKFFQDVNEWYIDPNYR